MPKIVLTLCLMHSNITEPAIPEASLKFSNTILIQEVHKQFNSEVSL